MNRVYVLWFARKVRYSGKVRAFIFAGALIISQFWVSFADIFRNLQGVPKSPVNLLSYFLDASLKTELQVQVVFAVAVLMFAFFVIDGLKQISRAVKL